MLPLSPWWRIRWQRPLSSTRLLLLLRWAVLVVLVCVVMVLLLLLLLVQLLVLLSVMGVRGRGLVRLLSRLS